MSNLYLHKVKKYMFRTIKDTIVFDLDKVKYGYEYEKKFLQKHPKHLKIVGSNLVDFWKYDFHFWSFPVEDITLCTNLVTYARPFYGFYNATNLKVEENVKKVRMIDTLGLNGIQTITIPFSISDFKNNCSTIRNKLKTLIIYNDINSLIIDLDKNFFGKEIIIEANKVNDHLIIKTNDKNNIEYDVYLKDNKLMLDKKYNKYEIKANEEKELDLPKLKEEYNCKLIPNLKLKKEKVILNKNDYKFLDVLDINILKELVIKDENEMSLIPRTIEINRNNGIFKDIEVLNDKLLIHIEKENKSDRYILINDDLNYVDIEKKDINKVYLDFDLNNYKLNEVEGEYNVTLPFPKDFNLENSKILSNLVNSIEQIYIKNKKHEILIKKLFHTNDEIINLINIEKNNKRDFKVVRKVFSFNAEKIYNFDENNNEYTILYVSKNENYIEEYNGKKLILKKWYK